jgi:hypothetical protein
MRAYDSARSDRQQATWWRNSTTSNRAWPRVQFGLFGGYLELLRVLGVFGGGPTATTCSGVSSRTLPAPMLN